VGAKVIKVYDGDTFTVEAYRTPGKQPAILNTISKKHKGIRTALRGMVGLALAVASVMDLGRGGLYRSARPCLPLAPPDLTIPAN